MLTSLGYEPQVRNLLRLEQLDLKRVPDPRWPASAAPEDLAVLLYTSGTSGRPKGVMLSHWNLESNIRQILAHVTFGPTDVILGVLPQFHSFGMTVLTLLPLIAGPQAVYAARFVPPRIMKLIRTHKPTALVAIPSMYNALLSVKDAGPEDFKSFRFIVSGGEPLPDAVAERFKERFGRAINEGYGLTETSPCTNLCRPQEHRPHSVGRPLPELDQRAVDLNTGRRLPPGEDGEIQMSGPNVTRGYFKLPAETAAAFTADGYFRTGDIGMFDADGHLYITGRLKEMLIVGGENVFPREIEEVLNRHPSVKASGVVGMTDPMRGELPVGFIELNEGHSFDERALQGFCRESLAGYKVPAKIVCLAELPRNPTGKIMRRELKKLL
jgi:long-chain acyl-CoA synthetase